MTPIRRSRSAVRAAASVQHVRVVILCPEETADRERVGDALTAALNSKRVLTLWATTMAEAFAAKHRRFEKFDRSGSLRPVNPVSDQVPRLRKNLR
jgi:hypothetical protein